jgi:hypothetical protein
MSTDPVVGAFEAKTRFAELIAALREVRSRVTGTVDVRALIDEGRRRPPRRRKRILRPISR